mmetsp:Transcript_20184/g.43579  ORF Transcript_20184/g.43579 Transcript_20184/m.43579 type:complete len:809 (-) Transcript_20184:263-2689(-)|eukprot:CAMPEP_0168719386 /NCGR_PEP_ID=MMETSP0724-20121128/1010_1 /TAXON_ID=265536 /ORGANISM="Amphiprora sp., Strain CCMP467" /LENGTH=808 /DNA_ID=CAMNT_0008765935 /DNA_START=125 /DNA_END=2551 /DNA_ORIENTATION=-
MSSSDAEGGAISLCGTETSVEELLNNLNKNSLHRHHHHRCDSNDDNNNDINHHNDNMMISTNTLPTMEFDSSSSDESVLIAIHPDHDEDDDDNDSLSLGETRKEETRRSRKSRQQSHNTNNHRQKSDSTNSKNSSSNNSSKNGKTIKGQSRHSNSSSTSKTTTKKPKRNNNKKGSWHGKHDSKSSLHSSKSSLNNSRSSLRATSTRKQKQKPGYKEEELQHDSISSWHFDMGMLEEAQEESEGGNATESEVSEQASSHVPQRMTELLASHALSCSFASMDDFSFSSSSQEDAAADQQENEDEEPSISNNSDSFNNSLQFFEEAHQAMLSITERAASLSSPPGKKVQHIESFSGESPSTPTYHHRSPPHAASQNHSPQQASDYHNQIKRALPLDLVSAPPLASAPEPRQQQQQPVEANTAPKEQSVDIDSHPGKLLGILPRRSRSNDVRRISLGNNSSNNNNSSADNTPTASPRTRRRSLLFGRRRSSSQANENDDNHVVEASASLSPTIRSRKKSVSESFTSPTKNKKSPKKTSSHRGNKDSHPSSPTKEKRRKPRSSEQQSSAFFLSEEDPSQDISYGSPRRTQSADGFPPVVVSPASFPTNSQTFAPRNPRLAETGSSLHFQHPESAAKTRTVPRRTKSVDTFDPPIMPPQSPLPRNPRLLETQSYSPKPSPSSSPTTTEKTPGQLQAEKVLAERRAAREARMEKVRARIAKEKEKKQQKQQQQQDTLLSEEERRDRAYQWYMHCGMISREKLKIKCRKVHKKKTMETLCTEHDVDLLPWNFNGTLVNVTQMNQHVLSPRRKTRVF